MIIIQDLIRLMTYIQSIDVNSKEIVILIACRIASKTFALSNNILLKHKIYV